MFSTFIDFALYALVVYLLVRSVLWTEKNGKRLFREAYPRMRKAVVPPRPVVAKA